MPGKKGKSMLRRLFVFSTLALAAHAYAAEAGKVIFVAGAAKVAERAGAEGMGVQEGELLSTGADGFLYIKTIDNGLFILRPNTQARIDAYHVDGRNPANTRVKLELIKGVARSKSGEAVKQARQNFRFNTPVAAIGVRGTDFTVYTDQDTSRVAVLTGGVVVSGFVGACRPDGVGPCEGATSRELSAAQRGQLVQVQRGQNAPQMLQGGANAPDLVSPPRADEPVAKTGVSTGSSNSVTLTAELSLDPRKSQALVQLVSNNPINGGVTKPPQPSEPELPAPPVPPVVDNPPVLPPVVEPMPPVVQLPDREIIWGRWQAIANHPADISLSGQINSGNTLVGTRQYYALFLTPGADYVADTRGTVSFDLKASEAYVIPDNTGNRPTPAEISNAKLSVDFGARTYATGFDLTTNAGEVFKLHSDGVVSSSGGLYGNEFYKAPTNMSVGGVLSNANGGTAAYTFDARLDATKTANGVTFWGAAK